MIIEAGGIIGDKDIWQHDQVVIVGRSNYDIGYLQKSIHMGRRFNFICQYMSQEDFVTGYLNGNFVDYRNLDSRLHYHPGLMYVKSQKIGWPLVDIYSSVTTKHVFWQILPPGEYTFDRIIGHYQHLRSLDNEIIIDKQRLELIYSLKPSELYIGSDEFKRYVVFYFDQACKAVLECPIFGNAIYVIDGGWKYLSQLTKAELMDYPDEVQRITHKGDWFSRLKKILDVEAWLK